MVILYVKFSVQIKNTSFHTGTVNKAGDTPLSLACANGHLATVKYLVNKHSCDTGSKFIYHSKSVYLYPMHDLM